MTRATSLLQTSLPFPLSVPPPIHLGSDDGSCAARLTVLLRAHFPPLLPFPLAAWILGTASAIPTVYFFVMIAHAMTDSDQVRGRVSYHLDTLAQSYAVIQDEGYLVLLEGISKDP